MTTEAKQNFNWHTVSNPNIAARIIRNASIYYITFDPDDGNGGGPNGSGGNGNSLPYESCKNWGGPERTISTGSSTDPQQPKQVCRFCLDDQMDHCGTIQPGIGNSGFPSDPDPNSPPPIPGGFDWWQWIIFHIIFGSNTGSNTNTGISIPPGPILGSPSQSFPSGSGGGGGSTTSTAPSVPPPAEPADDPNGGSAHPPVKKDSVIFIIDSCSDDYRKIVKEIEKEVKDVRAVNGDFDSVYRSATSGYPYELSLTFGRNPADSSMHTTPIHTDSSHFGVSINVNPYDYKTASNLHTHLFGTVNSQDLADVYNLLKQIKSTYLTGDSVTNNTNYVANSVGELYAISVTSTPSVLGFLAYYPESANLGPASNAFFKKETKMEALYRDFYKRVTNAGIDRQDAAAYGMALIMEQFAGTGMGSDIYKSDGLGKPFYRLSVIIDEDKKNNRYILTLKKCR